jgi:hypothetical protein
MADLYLKVEGDPRFQYDKIENVDILEQYIEQIELLLFTRKGDVLGEYRLGCDIEDLIYGLNLSEGPIKTAIWDQIVTFCPLHKIFKTDVTINFYKGTERDIAVIDIVVNDNIAAGIMIS